MTTTTQWAGTATRDLAPKGPGCKVGASPSLTITTREGATHEFFTLETPSRFSDGKKLSAPRAILHDTGALEIQASSYEDLSNGMSTEADVDPLIVFAAGTWTVVTGDIFCQTPEAPMVPAAPGWWAAFHFAGARDESDAWSYAPVVGWQPTRHAGAPGMTAWIANARTSELVRMDETAFRLSNYMPRGFTTTRPAGSNDWGM